MKIETSDEYNAAIARLKELGGNPADGAQQDEFLAISAAMLDYETRNHPAVDWTEPVTPIRKPIVRCPDDYERAVERIPELGTPPSASEDEAELFGLIDAVEKWEARHEDDAENWE